MNKAFCCGLLIPLHLGRFRCVNTMSCAWRPARFDKRENQSRLWSSIRSIDLVIAPTVLAQDWADAIMAAEKANEASNETKLSSEASPMRDQVIQATARSLPLLEDASSVPFVCRYRTDVISPLTTL